MRTKRVFLFLLWLSFNQISIAQKVPILSFTIDQNQKANIEIRSSPNKYYLLEVTHKNGLSKPQLVSMELGKAGTTILRESVAAYPKEHYNVYEYDQKQPQDVDFDGIDDVTEYKNPVNQSPFNAAKKIDFKDGVVQIIDKTIFKRLSYKGAEIVNIDPHLANLEFLKFYIVGDSPPTAQIYFMNSETHKLHDSFKKATKINTIEGLGLVANEMKGEIVFHPNVISANGTPGVYRFQFEPNDSYSFSKVLMVHTLIAANMPFLNNNLSYYPMAKAALPLYFKEKSLYDSSRIHVLLENDIYSGIEYLALNQKESFGLLRMIKPGETPSARDIVIYETIPNETPRVGGIITATSQTPLSHVNLRAIQDNIPNAYIKDAPSQSNIKNLIGKYVHYVVKQNEYLIEEVSKAKVNEWYEANRPKQSQIPHQNLSYTKILPLEKIDFTMAEAFGAKCANVATMRTFGFEKSTIPNGYGVPFYFYHEFMKYNNFYEKIQKITADTAFINNTSTRAASLKAFRKDIENGLMPAWMMTELEEMQNKFEKGVNIRCRSSTNNEDLPNFSGAGLYSSKTHKTTEGHIAKTIKEVYASLWNYRAFEERDFFRIDNMATSMAVLCHANYKNEKLNGVAVSTDPLYHSNNSFYLNNQLGEDLVTNPEAYSEPEEILLDNKIKTSDFYTVIRYSNLSNSQLILEEKHLIQLQNYIATIHSRFKKLYKATTDDDFAIEIEYKITKDDKLVIKQARPWVGANTSSNNDVSEQNNTQNSQSFNAEFYPNPFQEKLIMKVTLENEGILNLQITNTNGNIIYDKELGYYAKGPHTLHMAPTNMNNIQNQTLFVHIVLNNGIKNYKNTVRIIKK
jgi:hypothetical protein